jgi:4-alpha-glucanotransferase
MSARLVEPEYTDAFGERRAIDPAARSAILAAMGVSEADEADAAAAGRAASPVVIARPGRPLPAPGDVRLEDGTELGHRTALPRDTPTGYHRLLGDDGTDRLLLAGPGRCALPAGLRTWGWAIQLAALRSERSWGIGDLDDLRRLAAWSADRGAGFMAVSPLGAPNPGPNPEASPYYPSTRRFGSPLHLAVEAVPGVSADEADRAEAATHNADRRIDRARVLALKLAALEQAWRRGILERPAFEAWRAERGPSLERWAIFAALTEHLGPGWQSWPEPYRRPESPAVTRFGQERADRVAFHAWVQWAFDHQLAEASAALRRIADMPVGVDPGGFDAWDWQDQLAIGATVGAPPDRFNATGQDWGLPPFIPHRLRADAYGPFIDTIRAQLRHAGGLRIDHVLGLFRLWWIPSGHDPARGGYVRYPTDEMLEIVAIESQRANAVVIGEDLGTVPKGVRSELRRRGLLSTRLVYFERRRPARYVRQALAAVTTHDLPTIAGVWSGSDLDDQAAAGIEPDHRGLSLLRARLARAAGLPPGATVDRVVEEVHRRLAASPSMLVAATLEDALRVEERPNLPGTVAPQRDNWSLALPLRLEEILADPRVAALTDILAR